MSEARRALGSWLSGPQAAMPDSQLPDLEYRGQDLGLPESGPGSLAGGWHRVLGLMVDWIMCGGVAILFVGYASTNLGTAVLGFWFVIGAITVILFGFTPGQYVVGLRIAKIDQGPERLAAEVAGEVPVAAVGILPTLGRQLLICFLVPALLNDYNGRALHDRATQTATLRTR